MHRDLKPENILLQIKDNEIVGVKVADFGCCHHMEEDINLSSVGTLIYQDPNMQSGKYTVKCDIYSFGLIISEIIAGKHIFAGVSNHAQLMELRGRLKINFLNEIHKFVQEIESEH
jgi:calcium-dependent protein kinase